MKNRLIGLDQHHMDILNGFDTWEPQSRVEVEVGKGVPTNWTWLDDYLNDLVSRGFLERVHSSEKYRLTPEGRRLQSLSAQYNDDPDTESLSKLREV